MQADQLQSFINDLNNQKTTLNRLINNLQTQINSKNNQLTDIESKIKTKETTYQYVQQSYIAQIEEAYSKAEKEFDDKINNLKEKYEIINTEREKLIATIKKLQDTYTAVLEAAQRSEENKTNVLIISKKDKTDLDIINSIKDRLQQPRVLNMAIWTGYYKKAMDKLCVDIIGIKDKTGIYRITNIQTNQCYIGQAVNGIGR